MSVEIGRLDKLLDLQSVADVKDAVGGFFTTYTTEHSNVWTQVTFKRGNEKIEQDRNTATGVVEFKIRWIDKIKKNWIVLHEGDIYDITNIAIIGRRELIIITAENKF